MVDRDEEAFVDVALSLILLEVISRTARNDVFLVSDIVAESFSQADHLRLELALLVRYEREHVRAACLLERAVLVELVENDVGVGILLDLDDDPDLFVTVGFIS